MVRAQTDWRQVFLIWTIGLLAAAQFGKVSLNFELLRALYGRPDPELALIVSAVGVPGIVLGATAGLGVAWLGARRVLLWALTGAGALSLLQAALPPFWPLVALRAVEGLAHLALVVAAPVLIAAAAAPKDRALVMALWASFFGVSFALSAPIFAAFGDLGVVFLAHGLSLWALLPLAAIWVSRPPVATPRPWPGFVTAHLSIYQSPRKAAPALAFFWHTLSFIALLTFLPEALSDSAPQAVVAAVLPITALVGIFAAGWLARRIAPLRLCLVSFVVTIVLVAVLPVLSGWPQVLWAALAFLCIGVVPGAAFAAIPALNEAGPDQAEANGAMAQLGNIGTTSGSPIYAVAMGAGGTFGLMGLTGVIAAAGVLTVLWAAGRLRRGGGL